MQSIPSRLARLFNQWSGHDPETFVALPQSGSPRRYFRMKYGNLSAIGTWNPGREENEAFFYFSNHFKSLGLHVPELFCIDETRESYLLEDLGEQSLFSLIEKTSGGGITNEVKDLYRKSLAELVRFQVRGRQGIDYSRCYPQKTFDRQAILFDLNYFKYYFLKLHLDFHEVRLENDFDILAGFLSHESSDFFMYRDFQSRNIFLKNNQPYFIDYQGGRKGPLQYDVASLLFQVKADLPFDLREELLEYYISEVSSVIKLNREEFTKHYYGFVLVRLLQVLGAYGFRGLIEKKPHFLSSIPYALKNLRWWQENIAIPIEIPELMSCLRTLSQLEKYDWHSFNSGNKKLEVNIRSFSYMNGIPDDLSGNGGGFVLDCRALPNPGREERYRAFNGKDQPIIDYLKDEPEVTGFLADAERLVSRSVENYLLRNFSHLSVNFGCTGGRHRSVYCAETLASKLKDKFPEIKIVVEHKMLEY